MQTPYRRYENIEFIIPANNTALRIQFPDIPQLRSDVTKEILVRSIRVFGGEENPDSFNGNPVLTSDDLSLCFLTLYVDGEESIFRVPLNSLRNTYVGGATPPDEMFWSSHLNNFDNISVDWTKSYISLSTQLSSSASVRSIMFGIGYLRVAPGTIDTIMNNRAAAAKAGILAQL